MKDSTQCAAYPIFLSEKSLRAISLLCSTIASKSRIAASSLFKSFQPNSIGFRSGEYGGRKT